MSSERTISKSYKDASVINGEKSFKMWWLTHVEGKKYSPFKCTFIALCSLSLDLSCDDTVPWLSPSCTFYSSGSSSGAV